LVAGLPQVAAGISGSSRRNRPIGRFLVSTKRVNQPHAGLLIRWEGEMNVMPNVLLMTATIADIHITLIGLGVGCIETNPIVNSVGWTRMLLGKLFATLFVVFVLRLRHERLGRLAFIPGLVVTLFVLWNALNVIAQIWVQLPS